jgi:hypothetical protein
MMATKALQVLVPPVIVAAGVAIWLAPDLVHALDGERVRVPIEDLLAGKRPASRTVTVEGRAAMSHYLTEDRRKTEGGSNLSTGTSLYVPIVPSGWSPDQPVRVVLKTHYWGLKELAEDSKHDGVLRNVLWEGLDRKVASYFKDEMHLKLADDTLLLDGESSGASLGLILGAIGGAFLVVLLLSWNAQRKRAA